MSRTLGVDLGERRIGIALSDPSATIASPHDVLERSGDSAKDHQQILALARELEASRIVVGLPISLSGRNERAAQSVLAEVEAMRKQAGEETEIFTYDERFTTVTAERALQGKRDKRAVVDKVAAAVMLQAFLDAQ